MYIHHSYFQLRAERGLTLELEISSRNAGGDFQKFFRLKENSPMVSLWLGWWQDRECSLSVCCLWVGRAKNSVPQVSMFLIDLFLGFSLERGKNEGRLSGGLLLCALPAASHSVLTVWLKVHSIPT